MEKQLIFIKNKIIDFYAPLSREGVEVDIITNKVASGGKSCYESTLHLDGVAVSRGTASEPYYAMLDLISNLALQGATLTFTYTGKSPMNADDTARKLMKAMQTAKRGKTNQLEFDFSKMTFEQMNPIKLK
jgi:hypothetical protein